MINREIANLRLQAQFIARPEVASPGELLARIGAMQAQDYPGALWSIGLRLPGFTRADVEQAIVDRTIVRTWPMRGTLHFVAAADIRWMLKLLTPRVMSATAGRYRQLELDQAVFLRSRELITQALAGNKILPRNELYAVLEQGGVSTEGQRGIHILRQLCQDQVLCFGPHKGKQPTFVLLDEWITPQKELQRDEALQTIAERYFSSHGPATLQDFVGWTGLTITEAKIGLGLATGVLQNLTVHTKEYWMSAHMQRIEPELAYTYLLAGFDEFMLGYKDRSAALAPEYTNMICPGNNGMFFPTLVIDGQVCGTWKSVKKAQVCIIEAKPFFPLSAEQKTAIEVPALSYEQFIGMPVTVAWRGK